VGFLTALGVDAKRIHFSSDTSEEQMREFGKGRGTVDCCYPVKCVSGHYGELLLRDKKKIDVLLSPMIYSLPSFLNGHVVDSLACPRVMAAPENIKAGFLKEADAFAARGVKHAAPFVSLGDRPLVPKQLFDGLRDAFPGLTLNETRMAVDRGYAALDDFGDALRRRSRDTLTECAEQDKPCLLVLARPYHMDIGIGHEIEVDLQSNGYPVLWGQYLPTDGDLLEWLFREDLKAAVIASLFDISDVWPSQGGRAPAMGRGCHTTFELRMRHGPADLLARATDRGTLRDLVLLVSGSRFHQTGRLGEDPRRDNQLLPGKVLRRHHREEKGREPARLSTVAGNWGQSCRRSGVVICPPSSSYSALRFLRYTRRGPRVGAHQRKQQHISDGRRIGK
jgi:hypothetical protein